MVRTLASAFNAEGTYLPWTIFAPYPHVGPILLASPSGGFLGIAIVETLLFPLKSWSAEDRVTLGYSTRHFDLSPFVLGKYPPRHGPRALIERGPDHKFPGPTILFGLITLNYFCLWIYKKFIHQPCILKNLILFTTKWTIYIICKLQINIWYFVS